ncbi:hypothetical protein Tco_1160763 [Tanacetum coccineum]
MSVSRGSFVLGSSPLGGIDTIVRLFNVAEVISVSGAVSTGGATSTAGRIPRACPDRSRLCHACGPGPLASLKRYGISQVRRQHLIFENPLFSPDLSRSFPRSPVATFKVTSLHSSHSIFNRNTNVKTLLTPNHESHNDQQQYYHATHLLQKPSSSDTQSKGLKKTQGFSTITLHNKTVYFYNGNYSHDQSDKISKELQNLLEKMKVLGYVPNVDEKKQRILTSHNCHDAMKFISEITERKITVTDSYKVHHFQNGECSCDEF